MNRTLIVTFLAWTLPLLAAEKTATVERHVATSPSQRVELLGFSGSNIRIRSWAKDEVSIKINVSVSSSDADYERDYIAAARIDQESTSAILRLRWNEPRMNEDVGSFFSRLFRHFFLRKEVSGEIFVPRSNPLMTDMRYGTLTLEDMDGALNLNGTSNTLTVRNCSSIQQVDNRYGTTVIERSGGSLKLDGESSTVTVDDFTGRAEIDANYSAVTMARISEGVSVSDKSGKVDISDVGGDARVDANYSTITLAGVKGFVDLRSMSATVKVRTVGGIRVNAKYSTIEITDVSAEKGKQMNITGQSGSIEIRDAKGDLSIEAPYTEITLKRITGSVDLSSSSATIRGEDIKGNWSSRADYASVDVRGLTASSVTAEGKSGGIRISLRNVPRKIDIRNEYADVTVKLPKGFGGSVELDDQYGTIDTNFPLKKSRRADITYLNGTVGSGDGSISIVSKSSTIRLIEE